MSLDVGYAAMMREFMKYIMLACLLSAFCTPAQCMENQRPPALIANVQSSERRNILECDCSIIREVECWDILTAGVVAKEFIAVLYTAISLYGTE